MLVSRASRCAVAERSFASLSGAAARSRSSSTACSRTVSRAIWEGATMGRGGGVGGDREAYLTLASTPATTRAPLPPVPASLHLSA